MPRHVYIYMALPLHPSGLCVGVKLDVFFPGFPTLKHVLYRARLSHWGVKVFQMNSRGESMTLTVEREETDAAVSKVHVGWDVMHIRICFLLSSGVGSPSHIFLLVRMDVCTCTCIKVCLSVWMVLQCTQHYTLVLLQHHTLLFSFSS